MHPDDILPRSSGPGLQPERTSLAWHRTGVSGTVLAGVAMLSAGHAGRWWLIVWTALAAATTATLAILCSTPGPDHRGLRSGRVAVPPTSVWFRLVAGCSVVALLAVTGVLLSLVR